MYSLRCYVWMLVLAYLGFYVCDGLVYDRTRRASSCSPHLIKACDLPQVCYNGGTCEVNEETCHIVCTCPPNYTGVKCEELVPDPPSAPGNTTACTVDLCLNVSCSNGGTCNMNRTVCAASCECPEGYSGASCEVGNSLNTTSEPNDEDSSSSPHPTNVACQFPICAVTNPCLNQGECIQDIDCIPRCECTGNYTGDICETPITQTTTSPPPTLRPIEERRCEGGMTCYHGRCINNNGSFTCDCDPGHTGTLCHLPCVKDCGDRGYCDKANRTAPEICVCEYPYSGDTCEGIYRVGPVTAPSDEWKYWIVGSCLTLLVVMGLLLLLAYVLMRQRNIFIMRVLYYFQPYEDDDGKQFDAFVSYKSAPEDENFVYRVLYPELEKKRGFRLCLHQRDFTPGETIANNILWAIENSRRTILVMSPRYMESDFTRFEYQVAHDEMLKQKHKVIPLLLEDIEQERNLVDRTLDRILKSITYLVWPGVAAGEEELSKFWRRLELSLPKKKVQSEVSGLSDSNPEAYDNPAMTFPDDIYVDVGGDDAGKETDFGGNGKDKDVSRIAAGRVEPGSKTGGKEEEGVFHKDPKTKDELKSFFDEPVNENLFNNMRDKALEYEQTLDVKL